MENILSVEETKTRLICELSTVTGFKYLKSGILKKTVKDIVFEINFFSSKWNASGQSIEVNADLRIIYKKYGKLPVDNVIASMSYNPKDGYWYDISTESKLLETKNILEKRFRDTAMDLVKRFDEDYNAAIRYLFFEGFYIKIKISNGNFQFANLPFERGEILFSKGFFYLYGYSQTTR